VSTTIRVSRDDKARLVRLAKKYNAKTMTEALRKALEKAEESDERFEGNLTALAETLRFAEPIGDDVSLNVDRELANALED
jgi:predicted transcriptional regulator